MENFNYFLIVDLEATCCDQNSMPCHERECIEIGAVMQDANNLQVIAEFNTFIKPQRHPQLTAFCTELTSITQADVDAAPCYPEAAAAFTAWLQHYDNFLFCSWGDYDRKQLLQDSQFHHVAMPIAAPHLNIKKRFSETQGLKKRLGMQQALQKVGLSLEGTHHRGIDDARNMARLMPFILGRQRLT